MPSVTAAPGETGSRFFGARNLDRNGCLPVGREPDERGVAGGRVRVGERHMNRALTCARMPPAQWIGRIPYMFAQYLANGGASGAVGSWLENFRGNERPKEDISEYLYETFGIEARSLEAERDAADPRLRHALEYLWTEAHRKRREIQEVPIDEGTVAKLVRHDVECYCGVTHLRTQEASSPFGYSAWWLTVDREAFDLKPRLREVMSEEPPDSPVLSADFLVNYLAFGPVRRNVRKNDESRLPLVMGVGSARFLTPELIIEAERIREGLKELPDRIVRRRVRDYLDRARRTRGPIAKAGVYELDDEIIA